jgi:hypothetical protein
MSYERGETGDKRQETRDKRQEEQRTMVRFLKDLIVYNVADQRDLLENSCSCRILFEADYQIALFICWK